MSSARFTCDVLIVGGGPAGLSVAAALPDDVSVIIVHQDKEIGKPVRTSGGSWLSDMHKLGVPEHLYQVMERLDFYSDHEAAHFALHRDKCVVLDVTGTYQWLARKSEHKARKLLLGCKFVSARADGAGHVSRIRVRGAEDVEIASNYLIDASGHHCAVLQALGLAQKPGRVGVGVEYEYPIGDNDPHRAILFVGRDALSGYGWVFPTPDQRLRVGVGVIHPDTDASPKALYAQFLASDALERFGIRLEGPPLIRNGGIIPSVAYDSRLVFDRVIRVGDSANFATPTAGEGIRICIEMGALLGHKLGMAMMQESRAPLQEYEKACRAKLGRDYHFGFMANKRFSAYAPSDWDRSIKRIGRLSERQMIGLLRSEFSLGLIFSSLCKQLWHKIG